ncbi:MAG: hypothetical protein P1Q69_20540 [Candidatus Thorarchaeota archaeon]|nr:hypothetical protein [Candidatus Thorarchaeota archaeon]
MDSETQPNQIHDYESLILEEYAKMNFGSNPELEIERVSLAFVNCTDEIHPKTWYDFEEDGTLILKIEDTSIEKGLKDWLASMAFKYKASFIFAPFRRGLLPLLIPFIAFTVSLILFGTFGYGNLLFSLVYGPGLFTCFALPLLLILTKKKMDDNDLIRNKLKTTLEKSTLYTESEIEDYIAKLCRNLPLYHVIEYFLFIPILPFFIWLVFFLS